MYKWATHLLLHGTRQLMIWEQGGTKAFGVYWISANNVDLVKSFVGCWWPSWCGRVVWLTHWLTTSEASCLMTFSRSDFPAPFLKSYPCLSLIVSLIIDIFLQFLGLYRNWSWSLMTLENHSTRLTRVFTSFYVAYAFSLDKLDRALTDLCRDWVFFSFTLVSCFLPAFSQDSILQCFLSSMASCIWLDGQTCQTSRVEGLHLRMLRACWGPKRCLVNRAPQR
jgi:hypothetical protein